MTQATTTTQRYRATLARLAAGSLLAGGLLLNGTAGVAFAETPASKPASTGVALVGTPASGFPAAALTKDHHGRKDRKEYRRGHRDGFRQGTRDGHRDGLQQCGWQDPYRVQTAPDAYTRGWEAGYAEGYRDAFADHCAL